MLTNVTWKLVLSTYLGVSLFFYYQQSLARRTYPCHGQHACLLLLSGAASGTFLLFLHGYIASDVS